MLLQTAFEFGTLTKIYNDAMVDCIFEDGIPSKTFDLTPYFHPMDIPVSKYHDDKLFSTVPTQAVQVTIVFEKKPNEIFIEVKNDTNPEDLGWMEENKCKLYENESIKLGKLKDSDSIQSNITLNDLTNDILSVDHLYGFAVRDIKPNEIKKILFVLVTDGDEGKILKEYTEPESEVPRPRTDINQEDIDNFPNIIRNSSSFEEVKGLIIKVLGVDDNMAKTVYDNHKRVA